VIPVLKQQLQNRQPLTLTHPEMCRFFMLIPEAVALVLQSFAIGNHGDILVLDMGHSVRILDLARNLIRLSGQLEQDIQIQFTGLREGEKLHEELFYHHESILHTCCDKIRRTGGTSKDWFHLCQQLSELAKLIRTENASTIRSKIKEIVPEYSFRLEDSVRVSPKAQTTIQYSAVAASE
jgi:FlaA1/EpsC-like NDP-sugar epimerase